MKNIVKRFARDEKGQAMVLAVILLLVGGLIAAGLLSHMGAGLLAGEVYGRRTAELYAADAGVEDAIWTISNNQSIDSLLWQESDECPGWWVYEYPETLIVNERSVDITLYKQDLDPTCGEDLRYRIISTAASADSGDTAAIVSATTIEAYLSASYLDFSALLDYAIVSQNTIDIWPGNEVHGDVWLPDEEDLYSKGDIYGEVKDEGDIPITWPTVDQLSSYYRDDVNPADPYPDDSIDIKDTKTIGPAYIDGGLAVDNTGSSATLVLEGTVYITGNLEFRQPGRSSNYIVNLNGHTIFVEGSITFPANHVSVSGSGCIIAIGYINFQPGVESNPDDFVLVMSITDEVDFHPSGEFTGCIAGNANVQLLPHCTLNWIPPEDKGLHFPGMGDDDKLPPVTGVSIKSWEIKQQ